MSKNSTGTDKETKYESIKEMANQRKNQDESKKFNHFVDTGEVVPPKKEEEYMVDVLKDITELVRPGLLDDAFKTIYPPKKS